MEYGVKRIVFSSSATVYGNPDYLPIDEKHPTGRCTNPYGKTKFFMEEIMKDVCAANKVFNNRGYFLLLPRLYMCVGLGLHAFAIFQSSWCTPIWRDRGGSPRNS